MKISKKLVKRIFSFYNLAIIACIALIVIGILIFFKPQFNFKEKKVTPSGIEVVESKVESDEEFSENDARILAKKQFSKIGEKDVDENNLDVLKIQKSGEEYYYISSSKNTIEIKIKGGIVTMINSATVDE